MSALPAWLGGKRRLCPVIFALLAEQLPRPEWPHLRFCDPFCGGGAVSLYAKAQGFHVLASDYAERSALIARALIANSSVRLRLGDVLGLFAVPTSPYPRTASNRVPTTFSAEQATWIDVAIARAQEREEAVRSLLLLVVLKTILRSMPMSMPAATDARAAALGEYDRVSSRRLGHYLRARKLFTPDGVWGIAREVNAGVFGGTGEADRRDALEAIGGSQADVLYLDPPYPGTSAYEKEYAVLDDLFGAAPPSNVPSLDDLLDAAHEIPILILSYGGPTTNIEGLTALVARHRPVRRAIAVPYPHLKAVAREETSGSNRELIVVAGR